MPAHPGVWPASTPSKWPKTLKIQIFHIPYAQLTMIGAYTSADGHIPYIPYIGLLTPLIYSVIKPMSHPVVLAEPEVDCRHRPKCGQKRECHDFAPYLSAKLVPTDMTCLHILKLWLCTLNNLKENCRDTPAFCQPPQP